MFELVEFRDIRALLLLCQTSLFEKPVKIMLTVIFVHYDGNGIRKVERSRLFAHGNTYALVVMLLQKRLGKTLRLLPEENVAIFAVLHVDVISRRFRRGEKILTLVLFEKFFDILIFFYLRKIPVVEPRSLEILVLNI